MRLVFLGPPGVGKGTQAMRVGAAQRVPHVAMGDILRDAVARGTETGKKAKGYMDRGDLVPDAIVIDIIADRIRQADCRDGFVLDGFPRTLDQCRALGRCLAELQADLDRAVNLTAARTAIVERLSGRRLCRKCPASYHTKYLAPKKEGVCDACGGALYQRDDDKPETILNRLDVYERQTAVVVDFYRAQGILCDVSAEGDVGTVYDRILAALKQGRRDQA